MAGAAAGFDPSMLPPGVDPSDFIAAQQMLGMGGTLQQESITPSTPQNWGRMASRASPLSIPAKLLEAYLGRKLTMQGAQKSSQAYAQALSAFQPQDTSADIPSSVPSIPGSPDTGSSAATVDAPPTHVGGMRASPLNPQNLPPQVALRLYQADPKAFAEYLKGPEAVQLAALAGSSRSAAAQNALDKSTAIETRPGGAVRIGNQWVRNPNLSPGEVPLYDEKGNVIGAHLLEGAAQAAQTMEGAQTAGKVANTPMEAPVPGGHALRYPGQIPGLGTPPGAGPAAGTPPAPGAASGGGPSPPNYFSGAPPGGGAGNDALTPPPSTRTPAPTPGALPQLADESQHLWKGNLPGKIETMPAYATSQGVNQVLTPLQSKMVDKMVDKHAELSSQYGQEANLADQKMLYNSQARQDIANGAEMGPLSEWLTNNRSMLLEAGVPASLIPESGSVTPTLELNKALKNAALQGARNIFGPRMTQMEVKLQHEEMSPSATMTRDAALSLMQQDDVRNAYAKQRSNDYNEYFQRGGNPLSFEGMYSSQRGLQRFTGQYTTPQAAIERLRQRPDTLPDFKKTFGWDPTQ